MGRILGIDYGDVRLGYALTDPMRIIASAHSVETVQSPAHAANVSARLVRETGAELIVVGLPVNMDGSHGSAVQKAETFIALLKEKTKIPIETWDERLSTKSAHDALIEAGTRREKRKGLVDKVAAQIFLQNYLDAHG